MTSLQPPMASTALHGISSMATRALLAELSEACNRRGSTVVQIQSIGGVDAARRVQAGEAFDIVVLAADAIDRLIASGHALADSRVDLVRSEVAVAVRAGGAKPLIDTESALRLALLAAPSIGYSTGPSGTELLKLFERWGIADELRARLVQAPAGVPVGTLVARGDVTIGFQQLSELMNLPGIDLVGSLPEPVQIVTVFSAAVCTASSRPDQARALVAHWASDATAAAKRRHGMAPA